MSDRLFDLDGYAPTARSTDPATSAAAAASIKNLRETQKQVLALFDPKPDGRQTWLTDQEMIQAARDAGLQQSESGLRTRRCELVHASLLRDTGLTRMTAAGRRTIVWTQAL